MFFHTKPQGFALFDKNNIATNLNEGSILDSSALEFMKASKEALKTITEQKETKQPTTNMLYEGLKRADMGKELYEEYDQLAYESKARVDMMYYQNMLRKLDDIHIEGTQALLVDMFRTVRQIYEFVNVRPEIYGSGITSDILEESIKDANEKLSKKIFEHIDKNFYNLSPEKRQSKYLEESRSLTKQLIQEGVQPEKAIESAVKCVVIETLLTKIAFPFTTWTRVKHLSESDDYGLVFDQGELLNLIESFETKIHNLSKIVASIV
jgi:hypothetical protein